MVREIDVWFTMASTYTYLTVTRLPQVERECGITFRWRPFHLVAILREMKHVPFADKPAKSADMWRDITRRATLYGLAPKLPVPYPPKNAARANRIASLGLEQKWGRDFVRASYRRWFEHGDPNGDEPNVSETLRAIGQDAARVIALADRPEREQLLVAETDVARSLGIFGSPTFSFGSELFWGDDRLEDAIAWATRGTLAPDEPVACRAE